MKRAMDRDEYQATLITAYAYALSIRQLPLDEMLAAIEHAHAFGPFLDPTLYRDKVEKMEQDRTVLAALAEAKRKLDALPWPTETIDVRRRPYSVERFNPEGDPSRVVAGQEVQ